MKKLLLTSLIAALSGLVATPRAEAKNEGLAALGGFIGGVIVGSNLNDHNRDYRPAYVAPVREFRGPPAVCYTPPAPRGYWREVAVKNWVPSRWVESPGRYGRPVRILEPGHYVYCMDRVWVAGNCD